MTKDAMLRKLLEEPFLPSALKIDENYTRLHDDHDGAYSGSISVTVAQDGDAHVWISCVDRPSAFLRYRTEFGGGMSLRTHNALLILAEAIRRDNEARPISRP